MVLYRGSLKSCNYDCSYCPFSKHRMTQQELEKDREQWVDFIGCLQKQAEQSGIHAMMVTPYGEALVHEWYWEGLAKLSRLSWIKAAGAQTNLGFSFSWAAEIFENYGGNYKKLRLWATFHPEMTTADAFVKKCQELAAAGVKISAGAVGVPEHLHLLRQLREKMPKDIYVWINRMDGLKRAYSSKEIQEFSELDPYFYRELQAHPSAAAECTERLFIEGNQRVRMCNISPVLQARSQPQAKSQLKSQSKSRSKSAGERKDTACSRKNCSCYLAYGGRNNLVNQLLFGPWPLFRIPRRPKAVFLDIVGTLYIDRKIPTDIQLALKVLAQKEKSFLFFATTLPYEDARKRCRPLWHLFAGGVFAGGAHILCDGTQGLVHKESFLFMDETIVKKLEPLHKKFHFRMLVYRADGKCYKITLLHAHRKSWNESQAEDILQHLPQQTRSRVRYLIEDGCLQILCAAAYKAYGIRILCEWLHISPSDIFASGDSKEDLEMMEFV